MFTRRRVLFTSTLILLLVVACICTRQASAQANQLSFEHYTMQDGLSHSTVYAITQDSRGFMWFGTRAGGLNKFDGYNFTTYKFDRRDSTTISGNQVIALHEDQEGTLWAGTRFDGLNKFDPSSGNFRHYQHDENDSCSISGNTVYVICRDNRGNLWFGTNGGLCLYNRTNDSFIRYNQQYGLNTQDVRTIATTDGGSFWIGGKEGLILYDPIRKMTIRKFSHQPNNPHSISENQVESILIDRDGKLWAATRNEGLNCLANNEEGRFRRFKHSLNNPQSIASNVVRTLHQDKQGVIWVGTSKALDQLNPDQQNTENPEFLHHVRIDGDKQSILQNSIFSFFEDRDGNFWIGFYSEGISYLNHKRPNFTHIRHNVFDPTSLSNKMVSSFAINNAGLWVGTQGGGLNLMDRKTGKFTHIRRNLNDPKGLKSDNIRALFVDRDSDLWVGSNNGLHLLKQESMGFVHYLDKTNIYCITAGMDDEIWVGTTSGLFKINKSSRKIKKYSPNTEDPFSICSGLINTIFVDKSDQLWIGTKTGLNLYDRQLDRFFQFRHSRSDISSLSDENVVSICEDDQRNLWVGTLDGVNRYDRESRQFTRFGQQEGLPSDVICSIFSDHNEFLWVTTINGLAKLNPKAASSPEFKKDSFVVRTFHEADGLQDVDFLQNSAYLSPNGECFIGGVNGFNIFSPGQLHKNETIPPVYITGVKLFNSSSENGELATLQYKDISEVEKIELNYKQSFLTLEFVALNYIQTPKNRFACQMVGFDQDWIQLGEKREASYNYLPPGRYSFRVKASNNDGLWNEAGDSIEIIIHPPWWKTWWFRILAMSMILILGAIFYHWRLINLKKQRLLLIQTVKERTLSLQLAQKELMDKNQQIVLQNQDLKTQKEKLELANASKARFLSIIAHDLRSPFSSLLGFLDLLQSDYSSLTEQERMEMISFADESAKRIYDLTDNLLTWSKLQNDVIPFHPMTFSLSDFIDEELTLLDAMLRMKEIKLRLDYSRSNLEILADRNMLGVIIRNLISNAIKFTKPKGDIGFTVRKEEQQFLFEIADSGVGVPAHIRESLFGKNTGYSSMGTADEKGTGLGLVLCHEFVNRHNGKIWVKSQEGKGSTFYFTIPLN